MNAEACAVSFTTTAPAPEGAGGVEATGFPVKGGGGGVALLDGSGEVVEELRERIDLLVSENNVMVEQNNLVGGRFDG